MTTISKIPDALYVDQDYSVKPPAFTTIEKLMQSLKDNGPLVAVGKMGPTAYTEAPFKLGNKVDGQEVYGFKRASAKESTARTPVILLGAGITDKASYVYFITAEDTTSNADSLVRAYQPSATKIYVMTYDSFLNHLFDLHPIVPHGKWLFSVDATSILSDKDTEAKCKTVGQEIFDHYKEAKDDSEAGESAVRRICEASRFLGTEGRLRKAHIEAAWDGIGDKNWQWQR